MRQISNCHLEYSTDGIIIFDYKQLFAVSNLKFNISIQFIIIGDFFL